MSGVHHAEGMTCRAIGIVEAVIAFSAKINRIECSFIMAIKNVSAIPDVGEGGLPVYPS